MSFDDQPVLTDGAVALRPLAASDFDALAEAAADPGIWAGHPEPARGARENFRAYFDFLIQAGGTLIITEAATGRVIGCSRYYEPPDRPGGVGIGFTFLTRDHWGGATNRAVKALMLAHAWAEVDEVWFHIAPANYRSQTATLRLGARHVGDAALKLGPTVADWKCYTLTRADFLVAGRARDAVETAT